MQMINDSDRQTDRQIEIKSKPGNSFLGGKESHNFILVPSFEDYRYEKKIQLYSWIGQKFILYALEKR